MMSAALCRRVACTRACERDVGFGIVAGSISEVPRNTKGRRMNSTITPTVRSANLRTDKTATPPRRPCESDRIPEGCEHEVNCPRSDTMTRSASCIPQLSLAV